MVRWFCGGEGVDGKKRGKSFGSLWKRPERQAAGHLRYPDAYE